MIWFKLLYWPEPLHAVTSKYTIKKLNDFSRSCFMFLLLILHGLKAENNVPISYKVGPP